MKLPPASTISRLAVDRHLEAALGDIARLDVRMRMQGANAALFEVELDHHQFVRVQDDPAAIAI